MNTWILGRVAAQKVFRKTGVGSELIRGMEAVRKLGGRNPGSLEYGPALYETQGIRPMGRKNQKEERTPSVDEKTLLK